MQELSKGVGKGEEEINWENQKVDGFHCEKNYLKTFL